MANPFRKSDEKAHTMPYNGGEDAEVRPQGGEGEQTQDEAAEKAVLNQHGPFAYRQSNYKELVADAKKQMQQSIEANKTF